MQLVTRHLSGQVRQSLDDVALDTLCSSVCVTISSKLICFHSIVFSVSRDRTPHNLSSLLWSFIFCPVRWSEVYLRCGTRKHAVLPATHLFNLQVEWVIPALFVSRRASPHFGRYSLPILLRIGS